MLVRPAANGNNRACFLRHCITVPAETKIDLTYCFCNLTQSMPSAAHQRCHPQQRNCCAERWRAPTHFASYVLPEVDVARVTAHATEYQHGTGGPPLRPSHSPRFQRRPARQRHHQSTSLSLAHLSAPRMSPISVSSGASSSLPSSPKAWASAASKGSAPIPGCGTGSIPEWGPSPKESSPEGLLLFGAMVSASCSRSSLIKACTSANSPAPKRSARSAAPAVPLGPIVGGTVGSPSMVGKASPRGSSPDSSSPANSAMGSPAGRWNTCGSRRTTSVVAPLPTMPNLRKRVTCPSPRTASNSSSSSKSCESEIDIESEIVEGLSRIGGWAAK
mmetsp:Transcript_71636/g.191108  ORF Transcript_71636/g.191108 Transcript_71636/m.191108 type:complete len:332 (+) Transcript_71636:190-1185(+)